MVHVLVAPCHGVCVGGAVSWRMCRWRRVMVRVLVAPCHGVCVGGAV